MFTLESKKKVSFRYCKNRPKKIFSVFEDIVLTLYLMITTNFVKKKKN